MRLVSLSCEHEGPLPFINQMRHQSVQVIVRDNNVDQALKALKKKMQREGLFRELKLRNYYEKPSERCVKKPKPRGARASWRVNAHSRKVCPCPSARAEAVSTLPPKTSFKK